MIGSIKDSKGILEYKHTKTFGTKVSCFDLIGSFEKNFFNLSLSPRTLNCTHTSMYCKPLIIVINLLIYFLLTQNHFSFHSSSSVRSIVYQLHFKFELNTIIRKRRFICNFTRRMGQNIGMFSRYKKEIRCTSREYISCTTEDTSNMWVIKSTF